jgi:nicotinamide riboside transporter PnuC
MRLRYTSFWLILLGAAIEFGLSEVRIAAFWDGFETPNPSLFYRLGWLWTGLGCVLPGLVVGLIAARNAPWLSGLSYLLGSIANFCYHDGERLVPHQFLPDLKYWPYLLRDFLLFALLGAAVGFIAAWLRRRRRQMLAADKNSVSSALRASAPWAIVIANAILAALGTWGILRRYGESTAGYDALMPTPWETGIAPYILGLLMAVLVSAILTAARHRLGRYALMAVTTIYTLCLLILAAQFTMSMPAARIQWTTKIALSDFEYLVGVIGWWFISYWSLFRASPPNNRLEALDQK